MGFSVPAAMGAALGGPDREAWAITGDGGFQMTCQELMTLVQDEIPVKIALFDNKKLGMIRQWQEIIYAGNYHSAHLLGPDYLKLAEAYGIPAIKATKPDEVDDAIRFAQGVNGPRAHLVRDRRRAERLPDDAGRQGPVRPHRDVGREPTSERRSGDATVGPRPRPSDRPRARGAAAARAAGRRPINDATSSWRIVPRPARRPEPCRVADARAELQHRLAGRQPHRPGRPVSRMTITLHGDDVAVEQAAKQLYRLDRRGQGPGRHQRADRRARAGAGQGPRHRCEPRRDRPHRRAGEGRVLDLAEGRSSRRSAAPEREIDEFVALLRSYGIKELVRTGAVVMSRGAGSIEEAVKVDDGARCTTTTMSIRGARRADRRHHRLRLAGPRPCPEPARLRAST